MTEHEIIKTAPDEKWEFYSKLYNLYFMHKSNHTWLRYNDVTANWCMLKKSGINHFTDLRSRADIERIAELEDFVRDYAGQTCKCGYPNVCSTCKDIAYAKEILKGGERMTEQELNRLLTTENLARLLGVKPRTVQQNYYMHGHYKGYVPIRRLSERGQMYVWEKK